MLPSFRLIVVTFVCSFLLAFFGLRLLAPTGADPESLVTVAPLHIATITGPADWRQDTALPPFDVRFGASTAAPAPIPTTLTLHALDRARGSAAGTAAESPVAPTMDLAPPPAPPAESMILEPLVPVPIAPVTAEDLPLSRIETAALPEPTASLTERPANKDRSAALSEPLQTPPAVDTAGTSRPAAVPLPPKKKAQATRPAKPKATRAAVRRKPAATQTSANTTPNPFSALFGAPAQ